MTWQASLHWADGARRSRATALEVHQNVLQARMVVCFYLVRVAQATKVTGLSVVCADGPRQALIITSIGEAAWADAHKDCENPMRMPWGVPKGAKYVAAPS